MTKTSNFFILCVLFIAISLPFFVAHMNHYCIGGHLAHEENYQTGIITDILWVSCIGLSMLCQLFLRGPKKGYYLSIVLAGISAPILNIFSIIPYGFTIIYLLKNRKKYMYFKNIEKT